MNTYLRKSIVTALAMGAVFGAAGAVFAADASIGTITVVGHYDDWGPYQNPDYGFGNDPWDVGSDDGSGSASGDGEAEPLANAPNNPYNQNPATCHSDAYGRILHAAGDFTGWRTTNGRTNQLTGRGERITFEFDDGGTEVYIWIPGASALPSDPEAYLAPVPGSLKCPSK
jgi:hypothetical protein